MLSIQLLNCSTGSSSGSGTDSSVETGRPACWASACTASAMRWAGHAASFNVDASNSRRVFIGSQRFADDSARLKTDALPVTVRHHASLHGLLQLQHSAVPRGRLREVQ